MCFGVSKMCFMTGREVGMIVCYQKNNNRSLFKPLIFLFCFSVSSLAVINLWVCFVQMRAGLNVRWDRRAQRKITSRFTQPATARERSEVSHFIHTPTWAKSQQTGSGFYHPCPPSVSAPDTGAVSMGGAKNLRGERDGGRQAACDRTERAVPALQPRILQQQRLHLSALPTWNTLWRHLR